MKKRVKYTLVTLIVMFSIFPANVIVKAETESIIESTTITVTPFADVIETYWASIDGILCYRRWNSTRNYWVDPCWVVYYGN